MISKIVGLIILIGAFLGFIFFDEKLNLFINGPSFLISGLPIILLLLFGLLNKEKSLYTVYDGEKVSMWEFIGFTSLHLGLLGSFIGTIIMFHNMTQPKSLGPAVAICLLSMFYSLILFLISFFIGGFKSRPSYYFIPLFQLLLSINCLYVVAQVLKN